MASKSDFLTAFGGATTAVGSTKAFTAAAGNLITMSSHGLGDFTGPVQFVPQGEGVLPGGLAASTNYWLMASTANAVQVLTDAGVAVEVQDAGSGTHSMRATAQTLADQMEQSLDEVLTFPGNRSASADVNTSKFWTEAVQGMGF